jgi:hypothetical protein
MSPIGIHCSPGLSDIEDVSDPNGEIFHGRWWNPKPLHVPYSDLEFFQEYLEQLADKFGVTVV